MKRSDNLAWSQVKVGIFIIVAILLAVGGILMMGDQIKFFAPKGKISVVMTDVAGLKKGAPVWLAGVGVGIVTDIRFHAPARNNDVEMVLQVDRESLKKIGKDSVITVKTRGLMGEKYVDITPSRLNGEQAEHLLYGTPVARLDDVMQKAGSAFDRLNGLMDKMERGEGSLGRFTRDPKLYDNLVVLTGELHSFASSVNQGEGTLGKLSKSDEPYNRLLSLLENADRAIRDLQSADGTLDRLIHDRRLYDKLVSVAEKGELAMDSVQVLNKKLASNDSTIGKLIGDREFYDKGIRLLDRADNSLKSMEEITARVNRGEGSAGKLLSDRELYDRLNRTVEDLDTLVKDVKENPRRYIKFSLF
jgi:phospholipid/cholesterol/gamma-HCH transport system substrate-binding protein